MTQRIEQVFSRLSEAGKTALIPYITAGDPSVEATVPLMHTLVAQGADLIELGVPFSDPMADGPVIQKAVERALARGVTLRNVLEMVKTFREKDTETPVILMGYLNPIEAIGYETFAAEATHAGVDAVLTVDMPPEESAGYWPSLAEKGLDRIFLVSPTTPDSRLNAVNEQGSGFVYYVSLKGVTGSNAIQVDEVQSHVSKLRSQIRWPIGIGFGIRDGDTAYQMAKIGDAVIIGSALVSQIERHANDDYNVLEQAVIAKMTEFKQAIDRADQDVQ